MTDELDRNIIITMRDVRKAKMCSRGTRAFFLANNLDWDNFLNNGIDVGSLIDTNDSMIIDAIRAVYGRK